MGTYSYSTSPSQPLSTYTFFKSTHFQYSEHTTRTNTDTHRVVYQGNETQMTCGTHTATLKLRKQGQKHRVHQKKLLSFLKSTPVFFLFALSLSLSFFFFFFFRRTNTCWKSSLKQLVQQKNLLNKCFPFQWATHTEHLGQQQ